MTKTVVLCILDGWGYRENGQDNAISHAKTPHWDELITTSPHTLLEASERNVGLPEGQMGNSEVGHMNIGAGRIILQDLPRIDEAIKQGALYDLPELNDFIEKLKASKGSCHLMGLLSPGGIHSHQRHIQAIAEVVASQGVPVIIHAFLDGRDTPPQSAEEHLNSLLHFMQDHSNITLGTLGGRYYAMDRDKRWERIEKAYNVMISGQPSTQDPLTYLKQSYAKRINDEFVEPIAVAPYAGMKTGDGILMANFRADRIRQILTAFLDPHFKEFKRTAPDFAGALGVTEYSDALNKWMKTLFHPSALENVLGEVISKEGLKQLRIAETEKYAHVTFFFNGGREDVFPGEERILVPSPHVATYDLKPEMSAFELTDKLIAAIESKKYSFIVVNYANTDMVGHSGNFEAARKAVEVVDTCLGKLMKAIKKVGASLIVTSDHGNAEVMFDETLKSPHTAHTLNPVPFVLYNGPEGALKAGKLSDIAPTILKILAIPKPSSMTGQSLLEPLHV
ncbi:2,3-bisphosphoglycerate-independent phosphoglycerate mutase [Kamptonema cortianum]|nr:2,3-bisphosphoglycerate-independent phosphoglycerate mutase [Geitlerinema splendidum]MDK3159097.1 2,3-bisphosphoglycerate-independent phosphoglycerate mutase [Kamptonema cortianum]